MPFAIEEGIIKINGNTNNSNTFAFDSFKTKSKTALFWVEVLGYVDKTTYNASVLLQKSDNNISWTTVSEISLKSSISKQRQLELDNTKYYRMLLYSSDNTFTNAEIKIQLEYGTEKTEFVPYNCIQIKKWNEDNTQSKTYNFPLSEGQVLMEDGTIESKVVNPRNQVILDGVTEGKKVTQVALHSGTGLYYCACTHVFDDGKTFTGGASVEDLVCSHFQPATGIAINHCYRTANGPTFVFVLIDQTITTVEQANAWLSHNNVKVEYLLATPNETPFTPEQQAVIDEIIKDGTYKEVTHYTAEASLNPDMDIVYHKDLETILNNL